MTRRVSRLALGSANFGLHYGLSNQSGRITDDELEKILRIAAENKVEIIDTAQVYGDSEVRIGSRGHLPFKIVTKVGTDIDIGDENSLEKLIKISLDRLNRNNLYAVMLHRPEALIGMHGSSIITQLNSLKEKNLVSKIGVSIYSPNILKEITPELKLDIVQAPFNIFDQRILSSGWTDKLKANGTEIHVRSVFLQGLLLLERQELNPYFVKNFQKIFDKWFHFLETRKFDALSFALKFVLQQRWIDKVVVGVDSSRQLENLVSIEMSRMKFMYPNFEYSDEKLIDPSQWQLE